MLWITLHCFFAIILGDKTYKIKEYLKCAYLYRNVHKWNDIYFKYLQNRSVSFSKKLEIRKNHYQEESKLLRQI